MTKRRIHHQRTLLHEIVLGIVLAVIIGLPAYAVYFEYRTDRWPDWSALSFVIPFLVFAGFARGSARWVKNKP